MMHYLRLSSFLSILLLLSCGSAYKGLHEQKLTATSALQYKPEFEKALYRCVVDGRAVFRKFHLSGLLFFKTLEDHTTRAVFQNEMGFTFFDFEWNKNDSFKVNKIIPQLDKAALIKTLEKDMNLFLMKNVNQSSERIFTNGNEIFHRFDLEKGVAYYIIKDEKLVRIENVGKSKVTTISIAGKNSDNEMPESVIFTHHKANFTIQLNKINSDAD